MDTHDKQCTNEEIPLNAVSVQGVPKKRPHVLNAHNSLKNGTKNKSRKFYLMGTEIFQF